MKIKKLPEGGMKLTKDVIVLNILFTDNDFAISFLDSKDHSKNIVETYKIEGIDVLKGLCEKHRSYVPKEFENKNHYRYSRK